MSLFTFLTTQVLLTLDKDKHHISEYTFLLETLSTQAFVIVNAYNTNQSKRAK